MKIGLNQRQAWQRHVDRQRRQGGEQAEKEREPEPMDVEAGRWRAALRSRGRFLCGD
jgi:hypothetical protein